MENTVLLEKGMKSTFIIDKVDFKDIERKYDSIEDLKNPISKSLYNYLKESKPKKIFLEDFMDNIIKAKSASFRILMMIATLELARIGFLKNSIHNNDSIELIYA